jgi:hypothetical protein
MMYVRQCLAWQAPLRPAAVGLDAPEQWIDESDHVDSHADGQKPGCAYMQAAACAELDARAVRDAVSTVPDTTVFCHVPELVS